MTNWKRTESIGSVIRHHELGFRYSDHPGTHMRCVLLSYGDGSNVTMVIEVRLSPPDTVIAADERRPPSCVAWWKNEYLKGRLCTFIEEMSIDVSKPHTFVVDGNAKPIPRPVSKR